MEFTSQWGRVSEHIACDVSGGSVVEGGKAEKGQNGCGEGPGRLSDKMTSEQRPEVQQEGSPRVPGTARQPGTLQQSWGWTREGMIRSHGAITEEEM